MSEQPFVSYPGQVWATCWQSMAWLSNVMASGTTTASALDDPANAVFATILNGLSSLSAWWTAAVLSVESQNLAAVQALPLSLDPTTLAYFNARVAAVSVAQSGIAALPTAANPFAATGLLAAGKPAIADPGYLEWCMSTTPETAPSGMSAAQLPAYAQTEATAWLTVAQAVGVLQGSSPTSAYDTAARMYRCSQSVASGLVQLQSGAFAQSNAAALWNGTVALPTILLDASSLGSNPSSLSAQQVGTIRFALRTQANNLALLLLALREHDVVQPQTAYLRNSESLMDLAARTTGDFENWTTLAAINQLRPPYPGPTNPAVALSGKQLFLSGTGLLPDPDAQTPTYASNVLGTDWDFGPINGRQPTWLGDVQLITGLRNYARAIGRRLQTPLGSLIYHTGYGSRIPPEVGAVQSQDEAGRLLQYGRSAIAADPRTGSILSASGWVQPGFVAGFSALVQPIGPGAEPVEVNETIGARP